MEAYIKPKTQTEVFSRYLFSFASVHSTWLSNVRLFKSLENLDWLHNEQMLRQRIIASGAGLHNNRTRFIYEFAEFFWAHPGWFNKSNYETWVDYRDRVDRRVSGLGFAKAAFASELTYPTETQVLCTDVHVLRLYGFDAEKIKRRELYEIEKHWVDTCLTHNVPVAVARWLYWDTRAQHSDPRFWTWVFEKENYNERLAEAARTQK